MRRALFFSFIYLIAFATHAQNSGKSKSKDRFREKDNADYPVEIRQELAANSRWDDFSPTFYQDGIVLTSNRPNKDSPANRPFTLWFSAYHSDENLSTPSAFPLEIVHDSEGGLTFSADFKTLYVAQKDDKGSVESGKGKDTDIKIYRSERAASGWTPLMELPFCGKNFDCKHPSLSPDGKRLYFASNRPGGYGGFDIYYAEIKDQKWSPPINAGPVVNSIQHEIHPFIAQSGTLFFSSNGHNTLGGFDLFFSNPSPDAFQEVDNLNAPFNTPADETSIIMAFNGQKGFIVSDRAGGMGQSDIYAFKAPRGVAGVEKPKELPVEITVVDSITRNPLAGAAIYIRSGDLAGQKNPGWLEERPEAFTNALGQARMYMMRYETYAVGVALDGYIARRHPAMIADSANNRLLFLLSPQKINTSPAPSESPKQPPASRFTLPTCFRFIGVASAKKSGARIPKANILFSHAQTGALTSGYSDPSGGFNICLPQAGNYKVLVSQAGFKSAKFDLVIQEESTFKEIRLKKKRK